MELEKNGVIPFLDVFVTWKLSARLGHSVNRKPTHMDRYSHHYPGQKLSVVNSRVRRGVSISEPDNLSKELQHVKSSLQNNGYRGRDIQNVIKKHIHPSHGDKYQDFENSDGTTYLLFIHGVTERIG
ncbi:hypothetical protein Trydic_g3982 [Trypoxylus dichotomus]